MVNAKMAEVLLRMLETSQTVGADEDFRAALNGLTSIVRGNALLPGRKSVLFFSEGLRVPPQLDREWENLFSQANRANFSSLSHRCPRIAGRHSELGGSDGHRQR